MKLIGIATNPYVRNLRVVLMEKISVDFIVTDLSWPNHLAPQYNPLGKVRCLVMDDGTTLYDSSAIVDYLDRMSSENRLLPEDCRARASVKCLETLADGMMDAAVLIRLESKRPISRQSPEWIVNWTVKIHAVLKAFSHQLGEKLFLHNNTVRLPTLLPEARWDGWMSVFPR